MMLSLRLWLSTIFFVIFTACSSGTKQVGQSSPPGYDFSHPSIIKLPSGLAEISGISYYAKDTSVFAIEDEAGILYKIYLNHHDKILSWKYDKKHDFEDVVAHDSLIYAMVSNGDIKTLRFTGKDSVNVSSLVFPDASKKNNEFETLYYDDSLNNLIMVCKSCEDDNHKRVSAYDVDPASGSYTLSAVVIDAQPVADHLGMKKIRLKPSAAAINPLTKELFILCSVNKLLVVTDRLGHFRSVYQLDPALFKQPEGIAFTTWGDMIVSNEAHETGLADLLVIKYKKTGL
jgi:hypothetical protein